MQSHLLHTNQLTPQERQRLIEEILLEQELTRRGSYKSLATFCRWAWPLIEPGRRYIHNWHIDAISEHLAAVSRFELKKLIINIPPRHMKSLLVTVGFNAWVWLDHPERRFIFCSYAQNLSNRDAVKTRMIIESEEFQQAFKPKWTLREDQNEKRRFENTKTGFRFSTSTGGMLTGEGGDFLMVDDPQNALDMKSELYREESWDFFKSLASRANDQNKVGRVVIQQRLHEDDVTGRLLKEELGWDLLKLPAEFEPTAKVMSYTKLGFKDPRTTDGELLWPDRFTASNVEELKKDLGDSAHAQLQQDPKPKDGGLFKRENWRYYKGSPSTILRTGMFVDAAQKPGISNDYTVIAVWAQSENAFYLLHLWRGKTNAPLLEAMVRKTYSDWLPNEVVIEDKSAGSSLIQILRASETWPVIAYEPRGDKETRAAMAVPQQEGHKLFLPEGAPWLEDYISEHEKFPKAAHDDQVDTTSMMVERWRKPISKPGVRSI